MIVIISDPQDMRPVGMISEYQSLIWTERWGAVGDFEMVVADEPEYRSLKTGTIFELAKEGATAMMLETSERTVSSTGRQITLKGRSIEIVADYIHLQKTSIYQGSPESCAYELLSSAIHYDNGKHTFAKDLDLSLFKPMLDTQSQTDVVYLTDDNSVLNQFHSLLSLTSSGYYIDRNPAAGSINDSFYIRVKPPRENDRVFFSAALDDFESFKILKSISTYRNVVYVRYKNQNGDEQYMPVYNQQWRVGTALPWELGRRMYILDYTNEKPEEYSSYGVFISSLRTMASRDLSKKAFQNIFDGKLNPVNRYSIPTDYRLGDLISVLVDSEKYKALVTECIFSATTNGIEEYPTLQFMST